jgi:glycosyltransferase involved in cell wall biosynthesis
VFYSRGPQVEVANQLVLDRYASLKERTGVDGSKMRVMDKVDIEASMLMTDSILTIDSNGFAKSTYGSSGKPIKTWLPPVSQRAQLNRESLQDRDKRNFFCFAGNGFIAKGVDLVVEAFLKMPELNLTIAGPPSDLLFWKIYGERISQAPNITFVGFLEVGGPEYVRICRTHSWSVLPAAAEGVCTSVATTMRSGLLPIVTFGTAVVTGDFGFLLPDRPGEIIKSLQSLCPELSVWDDDDYESRVDRLLIAAESYSEDSYLSSVTKSLRGILDRDSDLI